MTNKVKEHNGFYYLLIEKELCTLILLNLKTYETKVKINQSLTTYLEQNLVILLYVDFIVLYSI